MKLVTALLTDRRAQLNCWSRTHTQRYIQILFFAALLALCSGCAARQGVPVGQIPALASPPKHEAETLKLALAHGLQEEGYDIIPSGPEFLRARRIIDRLTRATGNTSFTFPLIIADAGTDVNAMVADGKTVIVYRELLRRVDDDDELATVLAHEVGHVLGKHHEDSGGADRASAVAVGSSILGSVADIALTAVGFSSLGTVVGGLTEHTVHAVGMGAYALSYDRDMEYEADHIGMMLMAKAGYDPAAAIRFWEKSDTIFGHSSSLSFFSTHPAHSDRLDSLKEYLPVAQKFYRSNSPRASAFAAASQMKRQR